MPEDRKTHPALAKLGEDGELCATCGTPLERRPALLPGVRHPPRRRAPAVRAISAGARGAGGGRRAVAPTATRPRRRGGAPERALPARRGDRRRAARRDAAARRAARPRRRRRRRPLRRRWSSARARRRRGRTPAACAETVSNTKVTSEWPEGKNGWTVELGSLPKDGTTAADVEATKQDLTDKGATDVGVLDSDLYASLPAGNYVIYSGVFDSKGDADAALKNLGGDFPDATVVEVSTEKPPAAAARRGGARSGGGALLERRGGGGGDPGETVEASSADLEALENTTGDDYQEQINNIPDTIATPGEAPPDDPSVEPGGGRR